MIEERASLLFHDTLPRINDLNVKGDILQLKIQLHIYLEVSAFVVIFLC